MTTDTSEGGLEALIVRDMGQAGWLQGDYNDYDREFCLDLKQLSAFLQATQPEAASELDLSNDSPRRRKFLARLQGEIKKRGTIEVLRGGIRHGATQLELFYATPSAGNPKAQTLHAANRFVVTRQLHYSRTETKRALDVVLFINGLPVATFELKNNYTGQNINDAIHQYQTDRDPREPLFAFGRCVVHFAVDDDRAAFCTDLRGKASWFLPFNQGMNGGAGNPPNPAGIKTDYLWKRILTPESLTNILENYAQVVSKKDEKSGRKTTSQIFPRYHQLDVVRKLLADIATRGAGKRYLIQHSAGSGKSNSIAWLAHQLIGVQHQGNNAFDSIVVVTDRRILDKQIRDTIKQFAQVGSTVGHANRSGDLRTFLREGKKIIISTVQKFPFILDEISSEHRGRNFAILIDEAHSSQGGRTSAALSVALGEEQDESDDDSLEDKINRIVESKKLLTNASYFAFTATPKNKTLELFGEPGTPDPEGKIPYYPFHNYSMKQAIQEGFIMDVLANYTPVESYYKLLKAIEEDPQFDSKRASKKLRRYVEGHAYAIDQKAHIMVEHFHESVIAVGKVGGKARAMVVTNGIERAIQYYYAITSALQERKSPYQAIVAFSGEHDYGGGKVTEASVNGFPSSQIPDMIQQDPYRFLVCADKFQTGYDEPLLHTMYVDKTLSGIKAVQTLSRLNRAHPQKRDTFVLDFMNDTDTIEKSFDDFYRTTILSEGTDPNTLNDLQYELDDKQVYSPEQVDTLVALYLDGADREKLDPILDRCVPLYLELDEEDQVAFKGSAKAFVRTYNFLSQILSKTNPAWEKLSIFLHLLIPKLPTPEEADLSQGILEAIDMDSYRLEKKATMSIALEDEDATIDPVPAQAGHGRGEAELEQLSSILKQFNDRFGNINWQNEDRVQRLITEALPATLKKDEAYTNAVKSQDKQNARIELKKAAQRAVIAHMKDNTQFFKEFSDNEGFKAMVLDMLFQLTYEARA